MSTPYVPSGATAKSPIVLGGSAWWRSIVATPGVILSAGKVSRWDSLIAPNSDLQPYTYLAGLSNPSWVQPDQFTRHEVGFGPGINALIYNGGVNYSYNTPQFTVAVVARAVAVAGDATTKQRALISTHVTDGRAFELVSVPSGTGISWRLYGYANGGSTVVASAFSAAVPDGKDVIVIASISATTATIRVAGLRDSDPAAVTTGASGSYHTYSGITSDHYHMVGLGRRPDSSHGQVFNGMLGDHAMFNSALSDADADALIEYFRGQWYGVSVPVDSVAVSLSPSTLAVNAGTTAQATATPYSATGVLLTDRYITWSSSNTGVATVDAAGVVTPHAVGTASITATCETHTGSATFTVSPAPVATVSVSLASPGVRMYETSQATAVVRDSGGTVLTGRAIAWSSSDTAVATVDSAGLATAHAIGTALIIATSEGVVGNALLTVDEPAVATVEVSLDPSSVHRLEASAATAVTKDLAGLVLSGRSVTWASSDEGVATVDATGAITTIAVGTTTITATSEGVDGSALLTVTPIPVALVEVSLAPTSVITGTGATATAVTRSAAGDVLTGRVIVWTSSNIGVATVDSAGVVSTWATGTADIIATSEGCVGSALLTVVPVPVALVVVVLANPSRFPGQTTTASATTKNAAGGILTGRAIAYSSANPAVATVDPSTGAVSAWEIGTVLIYATSEGVVGAALLTVLPPPVPTSMTASAPATLSLYATGTATATVFDQYGVPMAGQTITWSASEPGILTVVFDTGVLTAHWLGTGHVTAHSGVLNASAAVAIYQPSVPGSGPPDDGEPHIRHTLGPGGGGISIFPQFRMVATEEAYTSQYPLDKTSSWLQPRAGSAPEKFPSGLECTWKTPMEHYLALSIRWVEPLADGTLGPKGDSWYASERLFGHLIDGTPLYVMDPGLLAFLTAARTKGVIEFRPNASYMDTPILCRLVEPMTGGVTLEDDQTRTVRLVLRSATEFVGF